MTRSVILDLIRTLAVGAVVGVHLLSMVGSRFCGFFGVRGFYFVSIGGVGVTALLVLSGMVLGLRYGETRSGYWSFLWKRYLRLYPTYYLTVAIGVAAYIVRGVYGTTPHDTLTLADIPLSLSATYAFVGCLGGPFVGTSWFLVVIMSLYALYPLIRSGLRRHPHITLMILGLISVASRLTLGRYELLPRRPLDWFPLCRVFEFGLGVYLARQIPPGFWNMLNGNRRIDCALRYMSDLTLPLFLVHWPILHTMKDLPVSDVVLLALVSTASLSVSACLLEIDKRVFTPLISRRRPHVQ